MASDSINAPCLVLPNGQEFPVTGELTIGRSIEADIKLSGDMSISRQHAKLEVIGAHVVVTDLGSSNGTWLNETRIETPKPLRDGDRLRVGSTTLIFKAPADATQLAREAAPSPAAATMYWQTAEPISLVRGDGSEFGLSRSIRIGRADSNDLALTGDNSASQNHAKIDVVAGHAIISDLGSRNGTWVNGKKIIGPTALKHGDKILIGDTVFRLQVGSRRLPGAEAASAKTGGLGIGILVGGGLLGLIGLIGIVAAIAALGGAAYLLAFAPTPSPAPTVAVAVTVPVTVPVPVDGSGNAAATQQAAAEQNALRALVWVVAPVGDPRTSQSSSTGSGSLIDPRGYVLTNFHVVGDPHTGRYYNKEGWVLIGLNWENASDTPDTFYRCEVVKADKDLDLALLRVIAIENGDPPPPDLTFPFLPIGDSDQLTIGDAIAVIGFPGLGGNTPTFTRGTVSGFLVDEQLNLDRGWIKTDAEVNPGNSGGMAINSRGELIGVPTQVFFDTEVTGKISEVRPINFAKPFVESIP